MCTIVFLPSAVPSTRASAARVRIHRQMAGVDLPPKGDLTRTALLPVGESLVGDAVERVGQEGGSRLTVEAGGLGDGAT